MNKYHFLLVLSVALQASGCASTKEKAFYESEINMSAVQASIPYVRFKIEPYPYSYNSGINEAKNYVVTNRDEWRSIWNRINGNFYPTAYPTSDPPEVDFGKSTMIVVALGEKPTGGHSILISDIQSTGSKVQVVVHISSPGAGCMTTQAVTSPVDIAKINKTLLPIEFKVESFKHNCH